MLEVDPTPFRRLAADLERAYGVRVEISHLALPGLCARRASSLDGRRHQRKGSETLSLTVRAPADAATPLERRR